MSYQYGYVKAFQYGLMYKANIDPKSVKINPIPIVNPPILSVTNKNHITIAIERAFADMANSGALRSKKNLKKLKLKLLQNNNDQFGDWAGIFYTYMTNVLSTQTFDVWHNNICNKILDDLYNASNNHATYGMASNNKATYYGMAQKIVNMAFKYLYCFDDANIYYNKFADCHMPLDSFTLKWFYSKVVPWYRRWYRLSNHIALPALLNNNNFWINWKSGIKTTAWSNLDKAEYEDIITLIRGYFANNPPIPPVTILEAEFVIWYEAKNGYSSKGNKKYNY